MSESNTVQSGGISAGGLITVILVCAKIFGVAPVSSWPWWQVLIVPIVGLSLGVLILLAALVAAVVKNS